MPTISVIVPVYNVEKYLRCCVDSILAQTFTDIEVLLVDDGSTDGSGAICDEYAQKDSRVRVFHKANGGVSSARNLGLDEAVGEWIMFVDSDDTVDPLICEVLLSHAVDGIMPVCRLRRYREECANTVVETEIYSTTYSICEFDRFPAPGPVAKLYKRTIIGENQRFNEKYSFAEDALFNLEYYCKIHGFTIIHNTLYNYRILPQSLSHGRYIPELLETVWELKKARFKLGKKNELADEEIFNKGYYVNLFYSLCSVMNNTMHKDAPGTWTEKIRFNNQVLKNAEFLKSVTYIDFVSTKDFTIRYLVAMKIACHTGSYFWLWLVGVPGKIKEAIKRKK